jgi:copper chaperone CopZ
MMHQRLELAAVLDAAGAATVHRKLQAVAGVSAVDVAEGASKIAVAFDGERTSTQELGAVLARAGYPLREKSHGNGSCCGGCGG